MRYQFDVEKIASRLEKYKSDLPLLYKWNPKLDRLKDFLQPEQIKKLDNNSSAFEKELLLKSLICERLNDTRESNPKDFERLCLWIIKDWGGITGAKSDDDTIALLHKFLSGSNSFERIASMSKVAAFLWPDTHVIYDARVAYALNWCILSENAGDKFFPIPEGRNSRMNAFDLNVLIRLRNITKYQIENESCLDKSKFISAIDNDLYIPVKEAYCELNEIVRLISDRLWEEPKILFYTEMLLFSLADRQVFKEITDSVCINIKSITN